MKIFTLSLKTGTFIFLIWIFQCFYKYNSNSSLIDKIALQEKIGLKNERTLAEFNASQAENEHDNETLEEDSSDEENDEVEEMLELRKEMYKRWSETILRMQDRFLLNTIEMSSKWKNRKWHVEWYKISSNKINSLSSLILEFDIPVSERRMIINKTMEELDNAFDLFLNECKIECGKKEQHKSERAQRNKLIVEKESDDYNEGNRIEEIKNASELLSSNLHDNEKEERRRRKQITVDDYKGTTTYVYEYTDKVCFTKRLDADENKKYEGCEKYEGTKYKETTDLSMRDKRRNNKYAIKYGYEIKNNLRVKEKKKKMGKNRREKNKREGRLID